MRSGGFGMARIGSAFGRFDGGGARNEDVTAFRHVLVEFDRDDIDQRIPKELQYGAIIASGLPVSVVMDSGN